MSSTTEIVKNELITDEDTNFLFLSDLLPVEFPVFFQAFAELLDNLNIQWQLLPGTRDIWCRDYMPVQLQQNRYVQFGYQPSYLRGKKWQKTITDTTGICEAIGLTTFRSTFKLDGGNLVKGKDKVLICDRVFEENKEWKKIELVKELEEILQSELVILPTHPDDPFGHADGTARFYNNDTVLVSSLAENKAYGQSLAKALSTAGLEWIEVPVNFSKCKGEIDATGLYLNYLQVGEVIILPEYGLPEDEKVLRLFEQLFPSFRITSIDCRQIAREGGVLNCVSWNVLREGVRHCEERSA